MTSLQGFFQVVHSETVRASLAWIFVLAHVLGDFLFQGDGVVRGRREGRAQAYATHALVHLALLAVLSWPALSAALVGAWLAVVAAHVAIDALKDAWRRRAAPAGGPPGVWAFLLDQAAHVWVIFFVVRLPSAQALQPWRGGEAVLGLLAGVSPPEYLGHPAWWRIVAVYAAVILGGAVLVRTALEACRVEPGAAGFAGSERELPRIGAYVGMLERALILTFLLSEAPAAVGFVIAAKSIARFKELEDKAFAEYYLVGTLVSVVVALGGYLIVRSPL